MTSFMLLNTSRYWQCLHQLSLCLMRLVCRNVVPAGLQVCLCRPAATRLSVRRLMRIYQDASLLALERRRFGYRRIWQLLRRKGQATERLPLLRPAIWSMDFVMEALTTVRRIKCLTSVDDFAKECLTIITAFGISGLQVTRFPDSIALFVRRR